MLLPIPHIIVTYLLIDRLVFRVRHKLDNTYSQFEYFYSIKAELLGSAVSHFLFWWGGFYDQFGWPQFLFISITIFSIVKNLIRNLKKKSDSFDISFTLLTFISIMILLYCGGFFNNIALTF
jgi:hypothetical protein